MKEASEQVKQEIADRVYNGCSNKGSINFISFSMNEGVFNDEDKERFVVFDSEDEEYDYDREYYKIYKKVEDDINDMIEQKFIDEGYDVYYDIHTNTFHIERPLDYIYNKVCKTLKNSIVGKEMEESIVIEEIEDALVFEFVLNVLDRDRMPGHDYSRSEIEYGVEQSFQESEFDGDSYVVYPAEDYGLTVEFIIVDDSDEEDPVIKVTDVSYDA